MDKQLSTIARNLGLEYITLYKNYNKEKIGKSGETLLRLYRAGIRIEPFLFGKDWESIELPELPKKEDKRKSKKK